jgi:hypothetical protein
VRLQDSLDVDRGVVNVRSLGVNGRDLLNPQRSCTMTLQDFFTISKLFPALLYPLNRWRAGGTVQLSVFVPGAISVCSGVVLLCHGAEREERPLWLLHEKVWDVS